VPSAVSLESCWSTLGHSSSLVSLSHLVMTPMQRSVSPRSVTTDIAVEFLAELVASMMTRNMDRSRRSVEYRRISSRVCSATSAGFSTMPGRSKRFIGGRLGENRETRISRSRLTPDTSPFCSRITASIVSRMSMSPLVSGMVRVAPTCWRAVVSHTSRVGGSCTADLRTDTRMGSRVQVSAWCGKSGIMQSRSRIVLLPLFSAPMVTTRGGSHPSSSSWRRSSS